LSWRLNVQLVNPRTSPVRPYRLDIALPIAWAAGTVIALVVTLRSLSQDDFDGLNNMLQIPLALPCFVVPTAAVLSPTRDACIVAGEGLVNALLLHIGLRRQAASGG
jgi:hypothetical protein